MTLELGQLFTREVNNWPRVLAEGKNKGIRGLLISFRQQVAIGGRLNSATTGNTNAAKSQ